MVEDAGQQKLDEGAVQFINEKLQFLREEIAPNLVFKIGFFNFLLDYSPIAPHLRQTNFDIFNWRNSKIDRDQLVYDFAWVDETGEIPRVLSMLNCNFPKQLNHVDPNGLVWRWEYSEVEARYLLGLIEALYDQGIDIPEQIYKDVILCTSAANIDYEGFLACMWLLRQWEEWDLTPKKKKIRKGLIVSAWVNVAAYGEFFTGLNERLKSWDKELLIANVVSDDLVELGNFHINLLGKDDFQSFVNNNLKKYSPQDHGSDEPYYLEKLSLNACLAIDEDEEIQTKLVNELIKAFDFKDGLSSELMITIKAVYCYDRKQLFDKYLSSILAESSFDFDEIEPLFEIPSDAFSKKRKTKSKKKNSSYLLDLISKDEKLKKSLDTNAPLKAIVLAKSDGQEALVKHLIENAGTIKGFVSCFDQMDGGWSLNDAATGLISSFIPKELLSAFLSLADRDKIVWFEWAATKSTDEGRSKPIDSYTLPVELFSNIYLSVMKSGVNSIHRYMASYIGVSRLSLLKLARSYWVNPLFEMLNEIAGKVADNSKTEVSNSVLLWLNKLGSLRPEYFKLLVSCEIFTKDQRTKLYSIMANKNGSYVALAISELISNGHDKILEQLIQKQHVRGSSIIANALLSACSDQATNELKSLGRETLLTWIKKIDATKDPTLARAMSQFFANGNLIPKDTESQKKYLFIASDLGDATSTYELSKFGKSSSKDWNQELLQKAVMQGSIFAMVDLAYYLSLTGKDADVTGFISSNLEKFEECFYKQSLHESWRLFLFSIYCEHLRYQKRSDDVWLNSLRAFEFHTERYLKDGNTFLDKVWLEDIIARKGWFDDEACSYHLSKLVRIALNELAEKQDNKDKKRKCLELINFYLDKKKALGFDTNFQDALLYKDYCLKCVDFEVYADFIFRENLFNQLTKELKAICFTFLVMIATKQKDIITPEIIDQLIEQNPELLENANILFWLSVYYREESPIRSFNYLEESCREKPDADNYLILGLYSLNGTGVPKNTVKSLSYFSLAKTLGSEEASSYYYDTAKNASKQQLSDAENLAAKIWEEIQVKKLG